MINEMANVYGSAKIGEGTRVGAFAEIGYNVQIGKNCSISCGVFIPENVFIGNNVFIGPHTVFTNDKNPPSKGAWRDDPPTVVADNVSIGANSTILPSICIGEGARIGAGSVVTKDVAPGVLVFGNPAKVHKANDE